MRIVPGLTRVGIRAAPATTGHRARHALIFNRAEGMRMKLEELQLGVLAFVDDDGRIWAQCAKPSQSLADPDYVVEGPLSGFVNEEGTFTEESEAEFRTWLADRLISDDLFYVKDKELALDFARRIAEAASRILKDRPS